mmetsp:Transcript_14490/g.22650  ORF Transcript_14490/g.22650 Transcript_14490/m.22650 type:complete len:275 (+) Transcript_14490:91-915(+)
MKISLALRIIVTGLTVFFSDAFSASTASPPNSIQTYDKPSNPDAAQLLELLKQKTLGTPPSDERINALIRSLVASRSTFDPETSINGPFFATVHFIGKTPLWEKISGASNTNIKGQKYTIDDQGGENTVVNYSEILGPAINLQATGTFTESKDDDDDDMVAKEKPTSSQSGFGALFQSFLPKKGTATTSKIKTCPYDYEVTVNGASINVFGKSLQIPISGLGCTRVLYADSCLRIFVSPGDTQVLTGGGDWESAGLTVVQVRIDLLDSSWKVEL